MAASVLPITVKALAARVVPVLEGLRSADKDKDKYAAAIASAAKTLSNLLTAEKGACSDTYYTLSDAQWELLEPFFPLAALPFRAASMTAPAGLPDAPLLTLWNAASCIATLVSSRAHNELPPNSVHHTGAATLRLLCPFWAEGVTAMDPWVWRWGHGASAGH